MPLARVDEKHLARADLARPRPVVELEPASSDDERDGDRVAVLRHSLAWLQAQADDPHGPAVRYLLESERTRSIAPNRGHRHQLNIVHSTGIKGARRATGTVVVIDVLRSFTVSAYALAGGARECRLVRTIEEARALAARTPNAVLCAEEDALPVEGIAISNSPTAIRDLDLRERVLIQRSSAGTQVAAEVTTRSDMFAASLVVARATAKACLSRNPETVTLIASADYPEDHACAFFIEELMRGHEADLEALLRPLRESARYHKVVSGSWPGFPPTDLDLALQPDRFEFAMPVTREAGYLRLTASF
jgi:2-phosphosulfolactate phosphatase